ncbi:MAG: hypothetical protein J6S09_02550 [Paludibacteraceae bacterium]|nr:hypothetical protein [Paludibacteraceae bacterium]
MRRVYNLIMLCILLICQQHVVAQSYNLGRQKQSFAYETLYANQHGMSLVVKSNNEITQPTQPMASPEYIQKCEQVHKRIETLINRTFLSGQFQYKKVSDVYKKLYHVLPFTEENLIIIQKIQTIVIEYFKSETNTYPLLQNQLKNASSTEEEIQIFLSYYQE